MSVDGVEPLAPEVFTLGEVADVLSRTGLDPEARSALLDAFTKFAGERALAQYEEGVTADIVHLAVIYERVEGEGASDSNIEGWYEQLESQTEVILRNSANRKEVGRSEEIARKLAALLYVCLARQSNHEIDLNLLQRAGFSEEEVLGTFREALLRAAEAQGSEVNGLQAKINAKYPALTSIAGGVIRLIWPGLISPLAVELRASLIADGHQLPVLNEDGLYAEEIDE
jgi:hypothetical protein